MPNLRQERVRELLKRSIGDAIRREFTGRLDESAAFDIDGQAIDNPQEYLNGLIKESYRN